MDMKWILLIMIKIEIQNSWIWKIDGFIFNIGNEMDVWLYFLK